MITGIRSIRFEEEIPSLGEGPLTIEILGDSFRAAISIIDILIAL